MNATKSMIGHCLGAAGGMEAIATIQAIRTGWVHPTINHVRPLRCASLRLGWVWAALGWPGDTVWRWRWWQGCAGVDPLRNRACDERQ